MTSRFRVVAIGLLLFMVIGVCLMPSRVSRASRAMQNPGLAPQVSRAVGFAVSQPLRDLPPNEPAKPDDQTIDETKVKPAKTFRT